MVVSKPGSRGLGWALGKMDRQLRLGKVRQLDTVL